MLLKDAATSLEVFTDALVATNAQTSARPVMGQFPTGSPKGFVVLVTDITGRGPLDAWLDTFRVELETRGVGGSLTAAPAARWREWLSASSSPVLTSFVAWVPDLEAMTTDPERRAHWNVGPKASREICAFAAGWAGEVDGEVQLRQSIFTLQVDSRDVADPLRAAVELTGMAGVTVVGDAPRRARHVALAPGGEGVFQVIDDRTTWQQHVAELRPTLIDLAEHTNHAFFRSAHRAALSVTDLDRVIPLPSIEEYHVRYNKHLLGEYVPDAHGLQVLREEHLGRAHDLSEWRISELGHGRYLVEAPDLEPWYSRAVPDPGVLEQARHDFGAMLLTEDVIATHPAPWTS